jgi:hypothetical protein
MITRRNGLVGSGWCTAAVTMPLPLDELRIESEILAGTAIDVASRSETSHTAPPSSGSTGGHER